MTAWALWRVGRGLSTRSSPVQRAGNVRATLGQRSAGFPVEIVAIHWDGYHRLEERNLGEGCHWDTVQADQIRHRGRVGDSVRRSKYSGGCGDDAYPVAKCSSTGLDVVSFTLGDVVVEVVDDGFDERLVEDDYEAGAGNINFRTQRYGCFKLRRES